MAADLRGSVAKVAALRVLETPDRVWRVEIRGAEHALYFHGGLVRGPRASMDQIVAWMLTNGGDPERLVEVGAAAVTFRAVADAWTGESFTLAVLRHSDDHEVWGDEVPATRVEDMPAASMARMQAPVPWRVAGDWVRDVGPYGPRWTAPVESRS